MSTFSSFKLKPSVLALMLVTVPMFAFGQQVTDVGIVSATGGKGDAENPKNYEAVLTSPVRSSVEFARPIAEISQNYIENFVAPTSTFASMANSILPGAYGYSNNGSGGGDEKIWFRGFKDGFFTMTFDGIPFNDTNDPTHHSQVFFPAPYIGGLTSDRSPGTASSLGPANFGGTIGILSKPVDDTYRSSIFGTYGSFNTYTYGAELASGYLKEAPNTKFLINVHKFQSDGAQTYNPQNRTGVSFKLESAISADTTMTAFISYTNYTSNAGGGPNPATFAVYNTPAPSVSQSYFKGNLMYMNSNDPLRADNYAYSKYDVTASFNYLGFKSNLGNGWRLDNKTYYNYYSNQQNYANFSTPDATLASIIAGGKGGVDKLNSYETVGNILRLEKDTDYGTLRTGLQLERSNTPRHQNYVNPVTGQAASGGIIFNETFITTIVQPYAEFAFKATEKLTITPGVKYNYFSHDLTQFADDNTIGRLGGAASVKNVRSYSDVLPFFDIRYMIQRNWSVYGQYATGDVIPPTSVSDVKGALVSALPKPMRTQTYQLGTVYQGKGWTFDADIYQTNADTSYLPVSDPNNPGYTFYTQGTPVTYRGIEAAGNIVLGGGFNLYANAAIYRATYNDTGLSVANVPSDLESIGLYWQNKDWALGATVKRIGSQWQDNSKAVQVNEAYKLDPIYLTNLYVNYTINNIPSGLSSAKIRFGVDNVFNTNYLTAFKPGSGTSLSPGMNTADQVTYTSGRAFYLSFVGNFD